MIIDAHAHIASWPTIEESEKFILWSQKEYGVSYSLISNCDAAEFPSVGDETPKNLSALECAKQALEFQKKHRSKIGVLVWIRPHYEKPTKELEEFVLKHKAIKGIKFHPYCDQVKINDPRMEDWYRFVERVKKPLLVHTAMDTYSSINYLEEVALKHPRIKFVAAHMELVSDHEKAIEVMKRCKNVYGDTAWVDMEIAKRVIEEVGEDRIMFGTDNPIDGKKTLSNPMYQDYFENKAGLSKKQYDKLMSGNAIKLYRLKD